MMLILKMAMMINTIITEMMMIAIMIWMKMAMLTHVAHDITVIAL